jgi:DNA polymerase III subunit alpha
MWFIHLHWHSQYSLLEAIGSTKAILEKLKEIWCSHAPIMDYNGMYNVIAHYEVCKKEWMSPIIWVDLAVQVLMQWKSYTKSRFITLIAKNYDGYMSLLDIVSRAQTSQKDGLPHLPISHFPATGGNVIVLVNGYESPLADLVQAWRTKEDIMSYINSLEEVFGKENVVLEVIPQSMKDNAILYNTNKKLREIHKQTWLPIICTNNFHYPTQEDKEAYEIALCIKDGKRIYEEDRRKTPWSFHIMSEDEMREQCRKNDFSDEQIEIMINTTRSIAQMISLEIPLGKILFPVYESPSDIIELYEEFIKDKQEE